MASSSGSGVTSGIGNIRADNADKLKRDFVDAKKGKGAGKRAYEEIIKKAVEDTPPQQQKRPKVTKGDVARTQHLNNVDKQNAAKSNKNLQNKIQVIRRYETSKLLGPILRSNADRQLLCTKVSSEKDADLILDHIREVLSNQSPQDKLHGAIVACAAVIEQKSGGYILDQPISGLTEAFYFSKDDMAQELEEFRCEYGNLFNAPWWARLTLKSGQICAKVIQNNKAGEAPHPGAKIFSRGMDEPEEH